MSLVPFEVYVRIRPFSQKEPREPSLLAVESSELTLQDPSGKFAKRYKFNGVFPPATPTSEVYRATLLRLLPSLNSGYNTTCFAYGSTGAGKTHTMFGDNSNEPGLTYLVLQDLFAGLAAAVKLSYLEIYNEHVNDLLSKESKDLLVNLLKYDPSLRPSADQC